MGKLIAVQGCTLKYEPTVSGSVELVATIASATGKVSSGGNKAYRKQIVVTVVSGSVSLDTLPTGVSNPGVVPPGTIVINGTSQKAKTEEDSFVLKEDEGEAEFQCVFPTSTSPYSTEIPVTIKAIVDNPGQNVINAT